MCVGAMCLTSPFVSYRYRCPRPGRCGGAGRERGGPNPQIRAELQTPSRLKPSKSLISLAVRQIDYLMQLDPVSSAANSRAKLAFGVYDFR